MYFDAHVHSVASPDSEMCAKEAISALSLKGLGVIFTEHVDFLATNEGLDHSATDAVGGTVDFVCDFDVYPKDYRCLRSDSVLLGLEIGLTKAYFAPNEKLACGDYDFILGSVHSVDGIDVYFAFPEDDALNYISRYLTYSREMVELCGFFDAFGHIDYVSRYNLRAQELYCYDNYSIEFDALLKSIAERDIALEINTYRFDDREYEKILLPICRRFSQLGGKYCTIGSDAHRLSHLGRHFDRALKLANAANLQVVYFKERNRYHSCP